MKKNIYSHYLVDEEGKVFDLIQEKYILPNEKNQLRLLIRGEFRKISLKKVYRQAFNKEFCADLIQDLDNEIWKPLHSDDRYFVSNKGRVKSYCKYSAVILKPQRKKNGYLEVQIGGKHKYIHRLVAEAFLPVSEQMETVDHIDFKRDNNELSNLRYLSRSDNARRRRTTK